MIIGAFLCYNESKDWGILPKQKILELESKS